MDKPFWRKLGDAPVIYSKDAAQETQQEIEKAVRNMGYMGAVVDLKEEAKGKRMKVSYDIHSGSPYIINNIAYDIADSKIRSYLEADSAQTLLHEGMRFDVNVLDEERQRITQYLQNRGYYRFNKDFITFQADTMLNTHKVDLTMELAHFKFVRKICRKNTVSIGYGMSTIYWMRILLYLLHKHSKVLILCVREMSVCFIKTSCFCVRK